MNLPDLRTEYVNSRNVTYRQLGGWPFRWSGVERPNGDPMLDWRDKWIRQGYAQALDRQGYVYTCGFDTSITQENDGTLLKSETLHGKRVLWRRDLDGNWHEDTTAAAIAHANLQTPANLRNAPAWTLPKGAKFDRTNGRGVVYDACKAWAGSYRRGEACSLWLTGEPGRGKSQLASWMLSDCAALGVVADRLLIPALIRDMRAGYGDGEWALGKRGAFQSAVDRAQRVAVLVLEDVSADRQAEDVRKLLYDILDARIAYNLPTIFTDNATPDALEAAGWDSRVASRCREALVLSLNGQDFRAVQSLRF